MHRIWVWHCFNCRDQFSPFIRRSWHHCKLCLCCSQTADLILDRALSITQDGYTAWWNKAFALQSLLIFGGNNSNSWIHQVDEFVPRKRTWSQRSQMPEPRGYGAAAPVGDSVLLMGGGTGKKWFNTCLKYDYKDDAWFAVRYLLIYICTYSGLSNYRARSLAVMFTSQVTCHYRSQHRSLATFCWNSELSSWDSCTVKKVFCAALGQSLLAL